MNTDEGKPELTSGELGGEVLATPIENPVPVDPASDIPTLSTTTPLDLQGSESGFHESGFHESGFQHLDPRNITVDLISGSLLAAGVTAGGMASILITAFTVDARWIWMLIIAGVLLFLLWLWAMTLLWPGLDHRFASWKLDKLGLEVRKGVLWRHHISVPRARVQHVDISQGPLQRKFDLAELTIFTAGTQNASVKLNGLAHAVATDVRNELISNRNPTDVV